MRKRLSSSPKSFRMGKELGSLLSWLRGPGPQVSLPRPHPGPLGHTLCSQLEHGVKVAKFQAHVPGWAHCQGVGPALGRLGRSAAGLGPKKKTWATRQKGAGTGPLAGGHTLLRNSHFRRQALKSGFKSPSCAILAQRSPSPSAHFKSWIMGVKSLPIRKQAPFLPPTPPHTPTEVPEVNRPDFPRDYYVMWPGANSVTCLWWLP